MAAIYSVFTSPHHAPMPNHLPTLIITPHGQPHNILYSYLHTDFNTVNYLLTPSPEGDLCVAKLFPPPRNAQSSGASSSSHGPRPPAHRANVVRCEASRELRWTIENAGVRTPIYKIVNSDETPLYQISKPNPNADFWTMFYFAYAGHQIPPRRVEFGKISKNPPEKGGGTRITVTGRSEDEKKVWQTLGEGNEDCVEWVIACACLNLLDDEILKAAERKTGEPSVNPSTQPAATARPPMTSANSAASSQQTGRSSPAVPPASAQASRSGMKPPPSNYDPSRPRSAEPPRGTPQRTGSAQDPRMQQRGPDPRHQQQQPQPQQQHHQQQQHPQSRPGQGQDPRMQPQRPPDPYARAPSANGQRPMDPRYGSPHPPLPPGNGQRPHPRSNQGRI